MRDMLIFGVMFLFIPLSLQNVVVAYLLWAWAGLIALNTFVYGFMANVPFVQVFAIITLTLLLRGRNVDLRKFSFNSTTILFVLLGVHAIGVATFAYQNNPINWQICITLLKILIFCICMPLILTNRLRIHALVVLVATSVSFYSAIEGLRFLDSGGAHHIQSVANLGDNNHSALAFVMVLPLLWYLYQYSENRLTRIGFALAFFLTCLAVIASNSRGGMVCMAAVAIWIVMKSRRKLLGGLFIVVATIAVVQLAPESWFSRMQTISTASEVDVSFQGRLSAWKRSSAIALENPVFGGGFHSVQVHHVFESFRNKEGLLGFIETPSAHYAAAAHSIYFESMGDMGFVGFFLFISCLINALILRRKIKNKIQLKPKGLVWASDLADSIAGCLIAYMVGGAAVSMAYFELAYMLIMLMMVLYIFVANEVKLVKV